MHTQGRGLALMRIVVGLYFLQSAYEKTTGGWILSGDKMAGTIQKSLPQAESFYRPFLNETVLPHALLFSRLVTFGEWGVGVSLVLGALVGVFLLGNFILMKGFAQIAQGTDWVFFLSFVAFLIGAAGMVWGFDAYLFHRRRTDGLSIARRPVPAFAAAPRRHNDTGRRERDVA